MPYYLTDMAELPYPHTMGERPHQDGTRSNCPLALETVIRTFGEHPGHEGFKQAERWLAQLVHDARLNGHGWTEIAQVLGTNPAEARLRYDPRSPIADGRWPYDL